jgi:hypothetical protein
VVRDDKAQLVLYNHWFLLRQTPPPACRGYSDGVLHLLQSRPITNLPPPPLLDVDWTPPFPAKEMIRRQIVENMPVRSDVNALTCHSLCSYDSSVS